MWLFGFPMTVAAADTPVPFATVLENEHRPTVEKVVTAGRELLRY